MPRTPRTFALSISAGQILQWNHSDIVAAVEVVQARALPGSSEHVDMKQARGPCTLAVIAHGFGTGVPPETIRKTIKELEETEARSRRKRQVSLPPFAAASSHSPQQPGHVAGARGAKTGSQGSMEAAAVIASLYDHEAYKAERTLN